MFLRLLSKTLTVVFMALSCVQEVPEKDHQPMSLQKLEEKGFSHQTIERVLFSASKQAKNVLLYFNGFACVNCSKNRGQNWTEENLTLMDSLYEMIDLKVDDPTPLSPDLQFYSSALKDSVNSRGKFYQHYQHAHFSYTNQPFYVIVNKRLNPLATYVDDGGIQGLTRFLMRE